MKTLYLIRHAKSSWDHPGLSDFDRPLNDRGKRDAPMMGKRLKERAIHPSLMLSSPAKRALSTCKRIAEVIGYPSVNIKTNRDLYHADEEQLLAIVRALPDKYETVMIFGHNPGLTEFVNSMNRDQVIPNIPTSGVVAFRYDVDRWNHVDFGRGEFMFFDFPKKEK